MRTVILGMNWLAATVSLIWLWGHSNAPGNSWEFWFALGYLVVTSANLYYFLRRARREEAQDLIPEVDEA